MKVKDAKKRKSDTKLPKPKEKKKKDVEEYSEVHFKVELKDPNKTFLGCKNCVIQMYYTVTGIA